METLYPITKAENDQNLLARHFFHAGAELRLLMGCGGGRSAATEAAAHLAELRKHLDALKAYARVEQSKARLAVDAISVYLEKAIQNAVGQRLRQADLHLIRKAARSATRREDFDRDDPSRWWFMVGFEAVSCDLAGADAPGADGLRDADCVLLNHLGPIIWCGEAARLVLRAQRRKSSVQEEIAAWLHAHTDSLWEPCEFTGKPHRFNGRELTEIEYRIMETARLKAYAPSGQKGLTSEALREIGGSAPRVLKKLRSYEETRTFLSPACRKKPLQFIIPAPEPPTRPDMAGQQGQ